MDARRERGHVKDVGWPVDNVQRFVHLMSKEDQERYDQRAKGEEAVPPPRTDRAEKTEQRSFANWLLLNGLPFCWHAMHKPSTATPGTLDFWVGTWGGGICLEFKRDYTCKLSQEQQKFWDACIGRGISCYLVYSADEAIKIIKQRDVLE